MIGRGPEKEGAGWYVTAVALAIPVHGPCASLGLMTGEDRKMTGKIVNLLEKKIERRLEEDLDRQMVEFRKEARDEIREMYSEFLEILLSEIEVELRHRNSWRKR